MTADACPYCQAPRGNMRDHVKGIHPLKFPEWGAKQICEPCGAPRNIHCLPGETLCPKRYCAGCGTPEAAEHEPRCPGHLSGKGALITARELTWNHQTRVCPARHMQSGLPCEILLADGEESHAGRFHRDGAGYWGDEAAVWPCDVRRAWGNGKESQCTGYHRVGAEHDFPVPYPEGLGEVLAARDRQVGGDHYHQFAHQPWDIIEEHGLSYVEGSALKYLLRRKGDRTEDLTKAIHCLERAIEEEKRKQSE